MADCDRHSLSAASDDWINYRPPAAALQPRSWSNGRIDLLGDVIESSIAVGRLQLEHGSSSIFVSLSLEIAEEAAKVRYLMGLDLTPMQREVAAFAFNGGERKDCADALRVSPEALKKHLRAVFDATGSSRWNDLQSLPATQWLSA